MLLLQKSMLTAEGVGRALNPEINMWELARPLIEGWMREHRGPEARVIDEFEGLLNAVLRRLSTEGPGLVEAQDAARLNTPDWPGSPPPGAPAAAPPAAKSGRW